MTEIQGKSILVQVSARLELARVRVIRSQLYIDIIKCANRTEKKILQVSIKVFQGELVHQGES